MIGKFSIWTKNLTLAIVIVSIIEMLLPNSKNKKYIKVVMGIYILFNILSPFINEKVKIDLSQILENTKITSQMSERVDQTSMNNKLEKICKDEIEKDITKKIQNLGYKVNECKIKLEIKEIENIEKTSNIKEIYLDVEKENEIENKEEKKNEDEINDVKIENKIVEEVEKIKKVQIGKNINKEKENKNNEKNNSNNEINKRITKLDIQKIKKYLIKEYEVKEKCLKIN